MRRRRSVLGDALLAGYGPGLMAGMVHLWAVDEATLLMPLFAVQVYVAGSSALRTIAWLGSSSLEGRKTRGTVRFA